MALHDIIKKGSTNRSVAVHIIDSTLGTPENGVVFNTAGIDLWYRREGAVKTSITEVTLAALTTAHADGGFLFIGDGDYRLDLPDVAFATGAEHVDFGGTVTGMIVVGGRVRLIDADLEDTVRLGLTALPNAAADAAGGLAISDAGGLDLDGVLSGNTPQTADNDTKLSTLLTRIVGTLATGTHNPATAAQIAVLSDWINGGRLDLILDIIAADTTTDIPALIAVAQADLDIITGVDGVTLATLQALYAPNKVVPDAAGVAATSAEVASVPGNVWIYGTRTLTAFSYSVDIKSINGVVITGDGSATPFDV